MMDKACIFGMPGKILFLFLVGICFYLFCCWTPMRADDYLVPFTFELAADSKYIYPHNLVSNLYEWIQAWLGRRSSFTNGRLSDCIASAILSLGGKQLFNVLNTVVFLCLIHSVCVFCFKRACTTGYAVSLFFLLVFLPKIVGTLLWLCGACNYLWGALLLMVVLFVLRKLSQESPINSLILGAGVACAFLCGFLHEALGLSLTAALFLHGAYIFLKHKQIRLTYVLCAIAVALGTIITLSSPAMWVRAGAADTGALRQIIISARSCADLITFSIIPLVWATLLAWRKPNSLMSPLGWFMIFSLGLALLVGMYGDWGGGYFYLNFALILYILQCHEFWMMRFPRGIFFACSIACILIVAVYAPRAYSIYQLYEKVYEDAKPNQCSVVDISSFGRAPLFPLDMAFPAEYIFDRCMWKWHDKEPFYVYCRNCSVNPKTYEAFKHDCTNEVSIRSIDGRYVVRMPKGEWPPEKIFLTGEQKQDLYLTRGQWRWYQRFLSSFRGRELGYMEWDMHDGFRYLVIPIREGYSKLCIPSPPGEGEERIILPLPIPDSPSP